MSLKAFLVENIYLRTGFLVNRLANDTYQMWR